MKRVPHDQRPLSRGSWKGRLGDSVERGVAGPVPQRTVNHPTVVGDLHRGGRGGGVVGVKDDLAPKRAFLQPSVGDVGHLERCVGNGRGDPSFGEVHRLTGLPNRNFHPTPGFNKSQKWSFIGTVSSLDPSPRGQGDAGARGLPGANCSKVGASCGS